MYHRYHLHTESAPDIAPLPSRFLVRVGRLGLAGHLLKELVRYRLNKTIVLSRPCMYGVFSGPLGGFAPREHLCVGCLRCMTENPEFVRILPNAERLRLGDSYLNADLVETICYEASSGKVPVKGAGYRGSFGGVGWDSLWTDMSEIVRPTRDGIHGRECISTVIDIGSKPPYLRFIAGRLESEPPLSFSIPIPMLFDVPPSSMLTDTIATILAAAADATETFAILPIEWLRNSALVGKHIVPLITEPHTDAIEGYRLEPAMIELEGWNYRLFEHIQMRFPKSVVCVRLELPSTNTLLQAIAAGARVFHLVANYHGLGHDGRFVLDLFREAHKALVSQRCRDEITILGGGGIVAAEHVPKAIICGCDGVTLDTPVLAALQAQFTGEAVSRNTSCLKIPSGLTVDWGIRRLTNLIASWRDQLLEVMGAMGLREVRRMRGEMGRAMLQRDLEDEAFSEIEGYAS